jgi:transposase
MGARFIGADREQPFLLPPAVTDWVPEDHLVWTVLEAVGELDLSLFYADYRQDRHGRPAYEPAMMVALLLYAYARGSRSARGIERACVEDVAYRVIAANLVPDHSTIAEFRCPHERALGEVFGGVLGLCARAGLASVGVVAIDGTKVSANASINANRDFGQIAREILQEAAEIDRREDELFGQQRGDELPEHLRTREGRRKALREARERLERERREAADRDQDDDQLVDEPALDLDLDPGRFVTRPEGRRAWPREGRRALDAQRERTARPIPNERTDRLFDACRRLEEELDCDLAADAAYERWRAAGVAADGSRRMARGRVTAFVPPEAPTGLINTTDLDSRVVRTHGQPPLQGYNAQLAVNDQQIVLAAEITTASPDFGHLEPMVDATRHELARINTDNMTVVLADAGYWHQRQMQNIINDGVQVLVPPDGGLRKGPRPGWDGGRYSFMRRVLATPLGRSLYRQRQITVEPAFGQIKFNRAIKRFQRRGRAACRSEWRLIAATHNILKLHTHRLATATG